MNVIHTTELPPILQPTVGASMSTEDAGPPKIHSYPIRNASVFPRATQDRAKAAMS